MSERTVFIALFLIMITHLGGVSQYVYITNGFEPSAINLALGGNPVAAVNFWNQDPLNSYGNPAFSSLYNGIHYSHSSYKYLDSHGGDMQLDYSASLMGVGFNGIGIVTSIIPGSATESDYGEIELTNAMGEVVGTMDLSDQAEVHGISFDLQRFTKYMLRKDTMLPLNSDLAFGVNYIRNTSTIALEDDSKRHATSYNAGTLLKLQIRDSESFKLEGAVGASLFNAFSSSQDIYSNEGSERIYKRLNIAMGLSASLPNTEYTIEQPMGVENLGTLRIMGGIASDYSSDQDARGYGAELGLGDMLFLRLGNHNDLDGNVTGISYGMGLRLNYHNVIGARFDYAHFPVVEGSKDKSCNSFGFDFDIIGFMAMFNNPYLY